MSLDMCPFCGCKTTWTETQEIVYEPGTDVFARVWLVECPLCGAVTKAAYAGYDGGGWRRSSYRKSA